MAALAMDTPGGLKKLRRTYYAPTPQPCPVVCCIDWHKRGFGPQSISALIGCLGMSLLTGHTWLNFIKWKVCGWCGWVYGGGRTQQYGWLCWWICVSGGGYAYMWLCVNQYATTILIAMHGSMCSTIIPSPSYSSPRHPLTILFLTPSPPHLLTPGLVCGRGLSLGDLIGTLQTFFARLGLPKLRFKPAYNPYTEPSMEIFRYVL